MLIRMLSNIRDYCGADMRLLGSCLEDEPMNIGTKPMKVEDSDAKKWEGFTDDDEDLAFTKNAWND